MIRLLFALACLSGSIIAQAESWDFTLHKHDSGKPGPTLLVIGGIQGDEPGGFNAASLLTTDYTIQSGAVWVVPNLNFESIIKRSRGVHGDMNRKFKRIEQDDPEYLLVKKIKGIITDVQVDMILNLHDGSGFYRPQPVDQLRGPNRWGQSLIIDQEELTDVRYGQLASIAEGIVNATNVRLETQDHHYHVKNTHTALGDVEMEKTLTFYAIRNGKSAFGIEASKAFETHYRAYYHLQMIESFMQYLGIEYQRNLDLSIAAVKHRIDNNVKLALYERRMYFDMRDVRSYLHYIPMKKGQPVDYRASNPLIAILDNKRSYVVRYGNRSVTRLLPQYFDFDNSLETISLSVDGREAQVRPGDIVSVNDEFKVNSIPGHRVNIIGFTRNGLNSEDNIRIRRRDIQSRYSVDNKGNVFRVEIYRQDNFCGMILVDFGSQPVASVSDITDAPAVF